MATEKKANNQPEQAEHTSTRAASRVSSPKLKLEPRVPIAVEGRAAWRSLVIEQNWAAQIALGMTGEEKRILGICSLRGGTGATCYQSAFLEMRDGSIYLDIDTLMQLANLYVYSAQAIKSIVERLIDIGALMYPTVLSGCNEVLEVNNRLLNYLRTQRP